MTFLAPLAPVLTTLVPTFLFSGGQIEVTTEYSSSDYSETVTSEVVEYEIWDLSEEEWQRYETLKKGIRGRLSNDSISPIEVLGIHARDDAERQRYAQRWASIMYEDAERVLKFQRAFDEAIKSLVDEVPVIDATLLPQAPSEKSSPFTESDRIMFFVETDCSICEVLLSDVLDQLPNVQGIDIYFTNLSSGNENEIKDWVKQHKLDVELIRVKQITVNFDNGLLDSIGSNANNTPALFLRNNDKIKRLPLYELW